MKPNFIEYQYCAAVVALIKLGGNVAVVETDRDDMVKVKLRSLTLTLGEVSDNVKEKFPFAVYTGNGRFSVYSAQPTVLAENLNVVETAYLLMHESVHMAAEIIYGDYFNSTVIDPMDIKGLPVPC